ncbi:cytochrome P450 [Peniophora sp. CONT]|nr:cytochrome P450 [Peniophora sp. CONT]
MLPLLHLSLAVSAIALSAYLHYRRKLSNLPHLIDGNDVIKALRKATSEKRGSWEVFDALAKVHGPIYSFGLLGTPVVVLSSASLGWQLLEKHGESYSSRPRLVTAHEILSGGLRGLSSQYNAHWKKWRKVQHDGMSARQAHAYRDHQTLEATLLLRDLARDTSQYRELILRFSASVVLSISYGRRTVSIEDRIGYVLASRSHPMKRLLPIHSVPGKHIVDLFPILLHLPRALQWFRWKYDLIFANDVQFYRTMVQDVQKRITAGTHKESMTSRALADTNSDLSEIELSYFVAAPFGAGLGTTAASIQYALFAALLYPEPTRKAQQELDIVVGKDRLPTFADMASLPYVCAWIKELERWRPIAPLAVPHATSRDDLFEGSFIPKGTTVYANIYTMMQDPGLFPDPDAFRPERFMPTGDQPLDPRLRDFTLPFGFGRRLCPGMHVASQSLFIVISRLLWAFEVLPLPGESVPDSHEGINDGLTRSPPEFGFVLQPRSSESMSVLDLEAAEADMRVKEWE